MAASRTSRVTWLLAAALLTAVPVGLAMGPHHAALADVGVAIDLSRVEVAEPLRAGEVYNLPSMGVRNPGTVATTYQFVLEPVESVALAPDADWVTFAPGTIELAPDERHAVEMRLELPADATPGRYEGLLSAQLVGGTGGAEVGAAAAARLTFEVVGGPQIPAWVWWLLAATAVLLALVLATRAVASRYRFKIERRA